MNNFYFTYGTDGQPFFGGWTMIRAKDMRTACALFRAVHPDQIDGILNCASVYDEATFLNTCMGQTGENFGHGCHETITVFVKEGDTPC